jgi:hypothetical protein
MPGRHHSAVHRAAREAARARGEKTFLGAPCRRKHSGLRCIHRGRCVECHRSAQAEYRAKNREKEIARSAEYRAENRDKVRAQQAKSRAENREKEIARSAEYRAKNREKEIARSAEYRAENRDKVRAQQAKHYVENREKVRARKTKYRSEHPEKARAHRAKRRALKFKQRCACCSDAQLAAAIATCPKGWETDHILPLEVSRLLNLKSAHCVANLQNLPEAIHREKTRYDHLLIATIRRALRSGAIVLSSPRPAGQS